MRKHIIFIVVSLSLVFSNYLQALPDWLESKKGELFEQWWISKNNNLAWTYAVVKENAPESVLMVRCIRPPGTPKPLVDIALSFDKPLSEKAEYKFFLLADGYELEISGGDLSARLVKPTELGLNMLVRAPLERGISMLTGKDEGETFIYLYSLDGAREAVTTMLERCGALKISK
ncbi:hypothetical protein NBRC116493_13750 [Aurantivibrio infirmus]